MRTWESTRPSRSSLVRSVAIRGVVAAGSASSSCASVTIEPAKRLTSESSSVQGLLVRAVPRWRGRAPLRRRHTGPGRHGHAQVCTLSHSHLSLALAPSPRSPQPTRFLRCGLACSVLTLPLGHRHYIGVNSAHGAMSGKHADDDLCALAERAGMAPHRRPERRGALF